MSLQSIANEQLAEAQLWVFKGRRGSEGEGGGGDQSEEEGSEEEEEGIRGRRRGSEGGGGGRIRGRRRKSERHMTVQERRCRSNE